MTEPESERGISLSHRERVADWQAVRAAETKFVSVTISENVNWTSSAAERNLAGAQEAGLHAGGRHYARPGAVHDQAEFFVRTASRLVDFGKCLV